MQKLSKIEDATRRVGPFDKTAPITHNYIDDIYIFYTPNGRLVQSASYDEAHAKWLLSKEAD